MRSLLLTVTLGTLLVALSAPPVAAQERSRHADTWTFGYGCRISWNADASQITKAGDAAIATGEGCASFSDPETGELLLYTDGATVWDGNDTEVFSGLPGHSSSLHSGIIVPVPGTPGDVYILGHTESSTSEVAYQRFTIAADKTVTPVTGDAGSISVGASAGREGLLTIQHANGIDYWILIAGGSSVFVVPVTSAGVGQAVATPSGLSIWDNGWSVFTASHQGDLIAMSGNSSSASGSTAGDLKLWDFDPATGALTSGRIINANYRVTAFYGGVFSPDGSKLYFSNLTVAGGASRFTQYDLDTGTFTILGTYTPDVYYFADGRLGPDGKIYVAGRVISNTNALHVVNAPNEAGTACGFVVNGLDLSGICNVDLGLPQSPSPLVRVSLELAVTVSGPGPVIASSLAAPFGSANAPNGSVVTATVTGPGGYEQFCTGVVNDATWACDDNVTGLGVGGYAVVAEVTHLGRDATGFGSFCDVGAGGDPADADLVCAEVCDDTLDNDANLYVDVYDPVCQPAPFTCSVPVEPAAFTIRKAMSTGVSYEPYAWPVTGDVDGDGETEIVAGSQSGGVIHILDGATLAVEDTVPINAHRGDNYTLAQLDDDPTLEIITMRLGEEILHIADRNETGGNWVVNTAPTASFSCGGNQGTGLGISVADFNADGKPEIFYGNEIWTYPDDLQQGGVSLTKLLDGDAVDTSYHGCYAFGSGKPQGMISAAADVMSVADCGAICAGPELIVAGIVFAVDVDTPALQKVADVREINDASFSDGFTQVADIDNDGDLDVIVHSPGGGGNLWAYDPAADSMTMSWSIPGVGDHGYSPVTVADVFDEDLDDDNDTTNGSTINVPDLVFTRQNRLFAVNVLSPAPLWELVTADASGATSVSVFDFNGDGVLEMVYRDGSEARVMYGGPLDNAPAGVDPTTRNYASFGPCGTATMNEGPTIADVDDDGEAEIVTTCGSTVSSITVFESDGAPWRPARRVWNQAIFVPGAIDEWGRVYPVEQARTSFIPEETNRRPLNVALAQISPYDLRRAEANRIPAFDAELVSVEIGAFDTCDANGTLTVRMTIANTGDVPIPGTLPVTITDATGAAYNAFSLDAATVVDGELPIAVGDQATIRYTGGVAAGTLDVSLNIDPESGPGLVLGECDSSDNNATAVSCGACLPEQCDGVDNDCDDEIDEGCDDDEDGWCDAGLACDDTATLDVCPNGCGDCDDNLTHINPGAAEICDGVDDDCVDGADNGCDDDEDGWCDANYECNVEMSSEICPNGCGDCDDEVDTTFPGATEVCNGDDDDCANGPDDNITPMPTTCGVGACARTGALICVEGSEEDTCSAGEPLSEADTTCDGVDDDCSGAADEDYQPWAVTCPQCQDAPNTSCVEGDEIVPMCTPIEDGTPCEGGICALAAGCSGGACVPTSVRGCDDGNPCTSDRCDAEMGCVNEIVEDGTACDDGNLCSSEDTCTGGVCDGSYEPCPLPGECQSFGMCNPATGLCDYPFLEGCLLCSEDTDAPVLTCPAAIGGAECTEGGTVVTLGAASASDECSSVDVTSDAPALYPLGTTTVVFNATDAAGNLAACATNVEVVDTEPPTLACPDSTEVEGDPGICGAVVTLPISAGDACDGAEVEVIGPEDRFFPPGPTDVLVVAVDRAGNQTTCETAIDVTGLDEFAIACEPTLTRVAPPDFCGSPEAVVADVVDACLGQVEVASANDAFPLGETVVDFEATRPVDGKVATCQTVLTVVDETPPLIDCGTPSIRVDLPSTFSPTAFDACGVELTIEDLGCERSGDDNGTGVADAERCDVELNGDVVVVRDAPASEGDSIAVVYTVTATDPSGNESSLDCRALVDPESLDHDGDGLPDRNDNCPLDSNAEQLDADLDGIGDACDEAPSEGLIAEGGGGCAGGGSSAPLPLAFVILALLVALVARRRREA